MDSAIAEPAIAEPAWNCLLMRRARVLSGWVGSGKPVTAKGVLRRADVGPAAVALGILDPGRVRTAADVAGIHRPWVAAEATGLLTVGLDRAVEAVPDEHDPAAQWLSGLRAVLRAESVDQRRIGATILCRAVLHVLDAGSVPDVHHLERAVEQALARLDYMEEAAAYRAFRHGGMPVTAGLELLAECGAVDAAAMTLTPLGRWAQVKLTEPAAPTVRPADAARRERQIYQLKIGLRGFQPPVWRRVLVPARSDLGLLHWIIQIALAWDDDHLHVFTADGVYYADPYFGLEECDDEDGVTLATVLPRPGASIHYRYDLGDCWDHTIVLEKVLEDDDGVIYPSCVGGRGDAPIEDWAPDMEDWEPGFEDSVSEPPVGAIPFDRDAINKRLAALTVGG